MQIKRIHDQIRLFVPQLGEKQSAHLFQLYD